MLNLDFLFLHWSLYFFLLHWPFFDWLFLYSFFFLFRLVLLLHLFLGLRGLAIFVIIWSRQGFVFLRVLIVRDYEIVFLFLDIVLVDSIWVNSLDFFDNALKLNTIIWVGLKHHLGLIVLFLFLLLLFNFIHLCFLSFFSSFSFFLLSLLYLFESLSFLLLFALLLFGVESQFVSGRDYDILMGWGINYDFFVWWHVSIFGFWLIIKVFICTSFLWLLLKISLRLLISKFIFEQRA